MVGHIVPLLRQHIFRRPDDGLSTTSTLEKANLFPMPDSIITLATNQ